MSTYINGLFIGELTPNATVGGCIDIYENAFPNPHEAIERIEQQCINPDSPVKFSKASTFGSGIDQQIRTNSAYDITHGAKLGDPVCQDINNQMYTTLLATTTSYYGKHSLNSTTYHENYQMLKYGNSKEYKQHYDDGPFINRVVSAIVYLNDNYEGGELEFPNFKIKIKPEPGMLILFPSNYAYAHIAHPVTSGTKYAIVTWVHDEPIK